MPRPIRPNRSSSSTGLLLAIAAVLAFSAVIVVTKYDAIFARGSAEESTPEQDRALGETLVRDQSTFREGLKHLEAAYGKAPGLPGLRETLVEALRRAASSTSPEDSLMWAMRVRDIDPSSGSEDLVEFARARVQEDWRKVISTTPADGTVVKSAPAMLQGTVRRLSSSVSLVVDGRPVHQSGTEFQWKFPTALTEGPQVVPLCVKLSNGIELPLPVSFTIDTSPPRLTVATPGQGGFVQERFRIAGRVEDATQTRVSCGDQDAEFASDGSWSLEQRLGPGPHVLEIVARDQAEHEQVEPLSVTVDAVPPRALLMTNEGEQELSGKRAVVVKPTQATLVDRICVEDDHGVASVTWDGKPAVLDARGMLKGLMLAGAETVRAYELVVVDRAGNSTVCAVPVVRDGKAPELVVVDADVRVVVGQDYRVEGEVRDDSTCVLSVTGRPDERLERRTFSVSVPVTETTRTLSIQARDEAGNVSTPFSRTLVLVEKCTGPMCGIVEGQPGRCTACQGTSLDPDSTCRSCKGRKTNSIPCERCKQSGKEPCASCGGRGSLPPSACGTCHGSRTIACTKCDENGKVTKTCPDCRGTGLIPAGRLLVRGGTCTMCNGHKTIRVVCHDCDQTKKALCPDCRQILRCGQCDGGRTDADCSACGGTKKVSRPCRLCGGLGALENKKCRSCTDGACRQCAGTGRAKP